MMKAITLTTCVLVLSCSNTVFAGADWGPGTYLSQALFEMMGSVRAISDDTPYGYDDQSTCIAAVLLQEGETYTMTRSFKAGTSYVLIAGGDSDVQDADLSIVDQSGNRVVADTKTDRTALFKWTPNKDGTYGVKIKLYGAERASYCAFSILRDGGVNVPLRNLEIVSQRFLERSNTVAELASKNDKRATYLNNGNACMFGSIIKNGHTSTISGMSFNSGMSVVIGATDGDGSDLDLRLKSSEGEIIEDVEKDNKPVVVVQSNPDNRYEVAAINATRTKSMSLVLFGVMSVE